MDECRYCNIRRYDVPTTDLIIEEDISLGDFGKATLAVSIDGFSDLEEGNLTVDIWNKDLDEVNERNSFSCVKKINFCPMCGRRLNDDDIERILSDLQGRGDSTAEKAVLS